MNVDSERVITAIMKLMTPKIEHMGISKVRDLNHLNLRGIKHPILVDAPHSDTPIAVIIPYGDYLSVQLALFGIEE